MGHYCNGESHFEKSQYTIYVIIVCIVSWGLNWWVLSTMVVLFVGCGLCLLLLSVFCVYRSASIRLSFCAYHCHLCVDVTLCASTRQLIGCLFLASPPSLCWCYFVCINTTADWLSIFSITCLAIQCCCNSY